MHAWTVITQILAMIVMIAVVVSGIYISIGCAFERARKDRNKRIADQVLKDYVERHTATWDFRDEAPKLTSDWFEEADGYIGEKLVRKGNKHG